MERPGEAPGLSTLMMLGAVPGAGDGKVRVPSIEGGCTRDDEISPEQKELKGRIK